jgi:CRP-like cAMP-binding protein
MDGWFAGEACCAPLKDMIEKEEGEYVSNWVASHGTVLELRPEAKLFTQGSPCRELFWIERGWIKLVRTEGTGNDIIVGFCQSGSLLGAGAWIAECVHPLTASTRTSARVWRLGTHVLDHAFEDRRLRRAILRRIGMEAVGHAVRCGALGCLGAGEHLERLLAAFATNARQTGPARVPLTTDEIAGVLGIDRSHARRLVRSMTHRGLIKRSRGWIIITDVARLAQRRAS